MTYVELELDVALEERLLGAHPDRRPEDLARRGELELSYLEPRERYPQLRKRKLLVGHEPDRGLVDLPCTFVVLARSERHGGRGHAMRTYLGLYLLEQRVVQPEEDITSPMSFLPSWWHLRYRALIHFPDSIRGALFLLAGRPLLPQVA